MRDPDWKDVATDDPYPYDGTWLVEHVGEPTPGELSIPLAIDTPSTIRLDGDPFHPSIPHEYTAAVYGVMAAADQHTFQVLTEHPERAEAFFEWVEGTWVDLFPGGKSHPRYDNPIDANVVLQHVPADHVDPEEVCGCHAPEPWPLPNALLGVRCTDQSDADARIPPLLECPAVGRFVVCEPLVGFLSLREVKGYGNVLYPYKDCGCLKCETYGPDCHRGSFHLDWVIIGGGSEPCHIDDVERLVQHCNTESVPVFVKKLGDGPVRGERHNGETEALDFDHPHGADPREWPEGLRVREMPEVCS